MSSLPPPPIPVNAFKAALRSGTQQIGLWAMLCSPIATEIVAGSGFDWLVLDMEHAPNEVPNILAQLQAIGASHARVEPVIRVPWNDAIAIKRVLDIGARSLLIPFVQNAAEAKAAVAAALYPPRGARGVSVAPRASRFGRIAGYHHTAHEQTCVVVQIETREALANLESIAAVDGVDAVFIGPSDLAADMGHLANAKHADVQAAIADACKRMRKLGKPIGMLTGDLDEAGRYLEAGFDFVALGSEAGVLAAATQRIADVGRAHVQRVAKLRAKL